MTVTRASKSDSKPSRRFRFSLRTLLVVMALVCIALGWKMNQVHRQRRAVEAILGQGGRVFYDFQCDSVATLPGRWLDRVSTAEPPGPAWFRKLVGDDFLANVVYAEVEHKNFADASALADLPHLMCVSLAFTHVSDLTPLSRLRDLEELHLIGTPVTDLSPLSNLTKLHVLMTQASLSISDDELRKLHRSLPDLSIFR